MISYVLIVVGCYCVVVSITILGDSRCLFRVVAALGWFFELIDGGAGC